MLFKKIKQKSLPNFFASASSLLLKCERRIFGCLFTTLFYNRYIIV